jgi:uncharacterized protein (DUF2384 family)
MQPTSLHDEPLVLSARSAPQRKSGEAAPALVRPSIDARVLALFDDAELHQQLGQLDKLELASVRRLTLAALERLDEQLLPPAGALDVHRRLLDGLAGESLLIAAALFLRNLAEAERFFDLSFKTIKARLGGALDTDTGALAMRAARATLYAADVLGSLDDARDYMHTRNFALGGATPADLIRTDGGERIVLNELQTQAEGGPL